AFVNAATRGSLSAAARIDLDEALKTLSPAERMCVSLCYGAGVSHAEAAEALNAPLGTVKSHVKRGLDKLRLRLAPPEGANSEPAGSKGHG
ncbi:MAG TPA: RNA polymerase sigma factor, partial [Caulobacter sp.]|nr:RNA polymerase sigma factor [Caulobacter sp.]